MNQTDLESRIVLIENELSTLKSKFARIENGEPWWKRRAGIFEGDPIHDEAMKLGREWRKKQLSNGDSTE